MSSLPVEVGSTAQAAHIRKHPDPIQDIAPSTAADTRQVLDVHSSKESYDDVDDVETDDDEDDIPYSVLRPARRQQTLPPLPDLRFEQSYLHSLSSADTWWKVALITTRDQVIMPLAQGLIYNLLLCGWQQWNRNARLSGDSMGARVRRWWWGINNWPIPNQTRRKY